MTRGVTRKRTGIEPHRRQRVDLLVDPHRADLGGERGAGAPGEQDRGHQRAELAQHAEADQVGDEDLGAEALHRHRRLEREDHAEQERDQRDDRQRVGADALADAATRRASGWSTDGVRRRRAPRPSGRGTRPACACRAAPWPWCARSPRSRAGAAARDRDRGRAICGSNWRSSAVERRDRDWRPRPAPRAAGAGDRRTARCRRRRNIRRPRRRRPPAARRPRAARAAPSRHTSGIVSGARARPAISAQHPRAPSGHVAAHCPVGRGSGIAWAAYGADED